MPKSPRVQRLSTARAQAPRPHSGTSTPYSPTQVPHQRAGTSTPQRPVTRSMTRANAAYTQALLTPPRTIRTYRTRDRTILPTTPSRQTTAGRYEMPGGSAQGLNLMSTPAPVSTLSTPRTQTSQAHRLPEVHEEATMEGISLDVMVVCEDAHATDSATHSPTSDLFKIDNEDILTKVAEGLKFSSRCDICYCLMQRPFTLECGHSACGPCLRRHFSSILAPRVRAIDCNVPTTCEEMEQVIQAAWVAGVLPRTMFSYMCPTCRKPIKAPPTDHISLKSLIGSIRSAFKDRSDLLKDEMGCVDESAITGSGYFAGLFMKSRPSV